MATVEDVLTVARRQIGFIEGPNNGNPYAAVASHADHQPWCASFVVACFKRAGQHLPGTSAYTPTFAQAFKDAGRWSHHGQPGDVVFFQWPTLGRIAHVGIVESLNPDGSYVCIEGNTDVKGGRTGGRVMRQVRRSSIAGFGRPAYTTAAVKVKPKPAQVSPLLRAGMREPAAKIKDVQRALAKLGWKVAVDGDFGPATDKALKAFQRKHRLTINGRTDPATWAKLRAEVHK